MPAGLYTSIIAIILICLALDFNPEALATVEICGDGIDNNNDGQIEEDCFLNDFTEIISIEKGMHNTIIKDSVRSLDKIENKSAEEYRNTINAPLDDTKVGPGVDVRSFVTEEHIQAASDDQISPMRATPDRPENNNVRGDTSMTTTASPEGNVRSWVREVSENSVVTLSCQICQQDDVNAVSKKWEQVSGAANLAIADPSSDAITFVAPEVDSAIGVVAFVLSVTDDKGVKYRENIEVIVKNRE